MVFRLFRLGSMTGGRPSERQFRHFAATQLLSAGLDVRTVAGWLWHASPAMTLDRYAAWVPARDREAADVLDMVTTFRSPRSRLRPPHGPDGPPRDGVGGNVVNGDIHGPVLAFFEIGQAGV